MLPQLESYSEAEIAARLGLDRRTLKARVTELRHEIVTGEPVVTILAAAAELGVSSDVARNLARKLGLRLVGVPSMFPAGDFERLAAKAGERLAATVVTAGESPG